MVVCPLPQVVEDHMTRARRKLRDPLKDTPLAEITHTNLPLLCRITVKVPPW